MGTTISGLIYDATLSFDYLNEAEAYFNSYSDRRNVIIYCKKTKLYYTNLVKSSSIISDPSIFKPISDQDLSEFNLSRSDSRKQNKYSNLILFKRLDSLDIFYKNIIYDATDTFNGSVKEAIQYLKYTQNPEIILGVYSYRKKQWYTNSIANKLKFTKADPTFYQPKRFFSKLSDEEIFNNAIYDATNVFKDKYDAEEYFSKNSSDNRHTFIYDNLMRCFYTNSYENRAIFTKCNSLVDTKKLIDFELS